jgi:hypothetical protein
VEAAYLTVVRRLALLNRVVVVVLLVSEVQQVRLPLEEMAALELCQAALVL